MTTEQMYGLLNSRGAETILYVRGTKQNKCCSKKCGDQYIGGPPRF